ncbi:MAG: hypothetical protein ACKVJQ_10300, partial [Alphaproteobacteria bacterium]
MAKQVKTAKRSGGIGTLPRWNLDDLYSGPGSKVMARDLARAEKLAVAFEKANKGRIKSLSGAKLGAS